MEIRIPRKSIAALMSAVLLGSSVVTAFLNYGYAYAQTEQIPTDESEITETQQETAYGNDEYEVTAYWKADLSEYNDNLSLVTYETVEVPTEAPTESAESYGYSYNYDDSEFEAIEIVPVGGESFTDSPQNDVSEPVAAEGDFVFRTYGYGHGVGMSQNGANHFASYAGWNYQQILQNYYRGTMLFKDVIDEKMEISASGVSGSVLDIVSMVTYNEVGGSMHPEAIKAQAVAVYTYIMNAGGSVDNLCPKPNPPQNVIDAVNAVLGEALYYNGGYALTLFSASSGGSTASCSDIFYEYVPYLTSVYCEYDSTCDPYYGIDTVISTEQVKSDLESSLGIILSDNPANWISVTEGDGGYAAYVTIDGQITIKGNDFIGILGLKSPKFTFAYG